MFHNVGNTQGTNDTLLPSLLEAKGSPQLRDILAHPETYRYQLIYTKIDRDKKNRPHFTQYNYRLDKDEYFNPASTVKMPLAFLALEKLNESKINGVDKFAPMLTDSAYGAQSVVATDTSAANGLPSIAHYIKKIFLVSDNDAYNRLYEFLGQQYINERLWKKGYKDIRITRRFVTMNEDQNRHTNPIRFRKQDGSWYQQPPAYSNITFEFPPPVLIGKAHYDREEKLVPEPMDFTKHNNVPLQSLHDILQSVIFPDAVPSARRFHLSKDDYRFLYQYMSELPSESRHPRYDTSEYFDSYTKFFMFKAGRTAIPPSIRIFNKPGWSYGFLTDVAYIVDFEHHIEFMLSGVIYVNSDGILNDDKYEYEQTGYPFFKEVGNIIYQYELQRTRSHVPDLQRFQVPHQDQ